MKRLITNRSLGLPENREIEVYNDHCGFVTFDSETKEFLAYSWIYYLEESRYENIFDTKEEAIIAVNSYT